MLQQILKDMYIDPDILEALNEEQKKILFLKMRQEQVRRWKEREDQVEKEGGSTLMPRLKKAHSKTVSWLLGRDGDVQVSMIGEADEVQLSKVISFGHGERKLPGLHNSMRQKTDILTSNLTNRASTEPARTGRENFPPRVTTGIQLSVKENSEGLKSGTHLSPLQAQEEDLGSGNLSDNLWEWDLSRRPHPLHRSTPPLKDKLSPTEHTVPLSARPKLYLQDSLEQHKVKGRKFRWAAVPSQAGPERTVGDQEARPRLACGRVAELMKNFGAPSADHAPARSKPPVPAKPRLQQLPGPSSLR